MNVSSHFISCDWGTTNFRLRLVERESLKIIAEQKTNIGIRTLYEQYLAQDKYTQKEFFANYLQQQIRNQPIFKQADTIVLTGMASSTIGLQELPYANFPFDSDGAHLISKKLTLYNDLKVILISGVKSDTGMMRGEEIQAVGLGHYLETFDEGVLLLPGTHSKHIKYEKGVFTHLTNFMTGELFEVLSQNSILSNSVEKGDWNATNEKAFQEGLRIGFEGKLSSNLLLVRARQVIYNTNIAENYYLLSGMLIGDELSHLKTKQEQLFLAASEPIFSFYKMGLELFFKKKQLTFFDAEVIEHALLLGQQKILSLYD